jgi:hypothetical protein
VKLFLYIFVPLYQHSLTRSPTPHSPTGAISGVSQSVRGVVAVPPANHLARANGGTRTRATGCDQDGGRGYKILEDVQRLTAIFSGKKSKTTWMLPSSLQKVLLGLKSWTCTTTRPWRLREAMRTEHDSQTPLLPACATVPSGQGVGTDDKGLG